ncbi:MAG TPA: hypothetical protein VGF45_08615 [Polyangia bacterium]
MPKQSTSAGHVTTDHETIRRWVEDRGGRPATVKRTGRRGGPGLLRIDYPGYSGEESLEPIEWEEFFAKFDESGLAFLYQEERAGGGQSRFSKLVSRDQMFGEGDAGKTSETNGRKRPRQATGAAAKRGGSKRGAAGGRKAAAARGGKPGRPRATGGRRASGSPSGGRSGTGSGPRSSGTRPRKSR